MGCLGNCHEEANFELAKYASPLILVYPKYDKKICYYQEFWKVYLINEIMISKIKEYSVSNKSLTTQIEELEVRIALYLGSAKGVVADLGTKNEEKSKTHFRYDLKIVRMPFS